MSTINITGTGGIIEGNLGAANVNVNLDSALYFDGSTRVDMNDTDQTAPFSVSAWINFTSGEHIVNKEGSWFLYIDSSNRVRFDLAGLSPSFVRGGADKATVGWHHVAATFDGSGNSAIYIDGVSVATQSHSGTLTQTSSDLNIGDVAAGSSSFVGYIADVKIFNDELTTTEPALLASKIQADCDVLGVGNLLHWYKLNEGTGTNAEDYQSGGSDADGTISNGTWKFDQYSVDVYDNSTTTDGTFTVTQGKVEGKALSHLTFDGSNDFAVTSDDTVIIDDVDSTIAFWYKGASPGTGTIAESRATSNDAVIYTRLGTELRYYTSGSGEFGLDASEVTACGLYDDEWHHVAFVLDHGGALADQRVYVDGVSRTLTAISTVSSLDVTWRGFKVGGQLGHINAELRDIKVFDYSLSAEQTSSLYSNTYPQTPKHNWKFDEGTGTSVEDSGTATDQDLTINGATYVNGTLDLDGTLTIAANGTMSCPRGNLDLAVNLEINCTTVADQWIHNSGKVRWVSSGTHIQLDTGGATFNNVDLVKSSGHDVKLREDMTILGTLDLTGSNDYWIMDANGAGHDVTLTMGSSTASGTIESAYDSRFRLNPHSSGKCIIQGASSLFPCNVTSNDWYWDYGSGAAGTELANIDFQTDLETHKGGSNTAKITLTGDCEFDAVTVSSGDTLDLNGQRAEFSGTLNIDGTLDADGLIVSSGSIDEDGGFSNADSCDMILTGAVSHDFRGATHRNILINTGTGTSTNNATKDLGTTPFTIGSGTFSNGSSGRNLTCGNFTIATGGTYTADDATVTVAGDFTTSGGLLGASCAEFNGSSESAATSSTTTWGFGDAFSIEFWFKTSFNGSSNVLDFAESSGSDNRIQVIQSASEMAFKVYNSSGSSYQLGTTAFAINPDDGKWHHLAYTNSGSEQKIYYDGRLAGTSSHTIDRDSDPSMKLTVGMHTSLGSHYSGFMEELRFFSDVRTVGEIRADMFQGGTLANSGNLSARYSFDEGSGTAVDNSETTAARDLVASGTGVWAGAGTFTYGTSTLKMTGTSKKINYTGDLSVYKLTIATGGDSNTINLNEINGNNSGIVVFHTLEQESGKLASTSNEYIQIGRTFGNVKVAAGKGAIAFADVAKWFIFQNGQSGTMNFPASDSADKDLTIQTMFINSSSSIEALSQGNLTVTATLFVDGGNTFNANSKTIAAKVVDIDNGTLDLRNSNLNFSVTHSGDQLNLATTATLLSGNSAITGNSVSSKTNFFAPSAGGFELVGDIKHMDMQADADLTVVGSVTACNLTGTGANIRQWHHTLDTQQLLDADEAGDDDLRLTKPALDNALELMTK